MLQPFEKTEDRYIVEAFLGECEPGAHLSYEAIAHATGVAMDERGKGILRRALQGLKIEYLCERNYGIRLACAENTMGVVATRFQRIHGALSRGKRSHENLSRFEDALTEEERKRFFKLGYTFGVMVASAEALRHEYRMQQKRVRPYVAPLSLPVPGKG